MSNNDDLHWMELAIDLANSGYPAPNPRVGCVIVQDGLLVGQGYHDHAGGSHAEINALASAGSRAEGADVYVTLEPCSHHGRTPPCTEALIQAKVKRVFFASPDESTHGEARVGGAAVLKQAGIEVVGGLLQDQADAGNRVFHHFTKHRRPYVCLKAAITLDGFIADSSGKSQWITGAEAREVGHKLRAEMGCVLIGRHTAQLDNPSLTARIDGVVNQPLRVVLDPSGRLSPDLRVFAEGGEFLWLVRKPELPQQTLHTDFSPEGILQRIAEAGCRGVLVEGGASTYQKFLASELVDELHLFIAPKLLGTGIAWSSDYRLGLEERFGPVQQVEQLGQDVHMSIRRS